VEAVSDIEPPDYERGESVPTRNAYGHGLNHVAPAFSHLVALAGEVSNSTRAEYFAHKHPGRFFEMFVAEQNMVGAALGLALRGCEPFVSTFAAFMTRAADQIRMSQYSTPTLRFVGSHAGVSIGPDGPSQMGLEDLALFRSLVDAVVLYPCDAMSTERLVEAMAAHEGIAYLRTTRGKTPVLYDRDATFRIGGSTVLRESEADEVTLIAAGITVHEALEAHARLAGAGLAARVIDLYSVAPLDVATLRAAADATELLVTIEDHYAAGGIGEAVCAALSDHPTPIRMLAVRDRPRSGAPEAQLEDHGLSASRIVDAVRAARRRPPA
jgi:transketolase